MMFCALLIAPSTPGMEWRRLCGSRWDGRRRRCAPLLQAKYLLQTAAF